MWNFQRVRFLVFHRPLSARDVSYRRNQLRDTNLLLQFKQRIRRHKFDKKKLCLRATVHFARRSRRQEPAKKKSHFLNAFLTSSVDLS